MDTAVDAQIRALDGVTPRRWFGMDGYAVGGRIFATWWGEQLVLKLFGEFHAQASAMPGAHAFDPRGGHPMKEWVVLPMPYSSADVVLFIAAAHAYVAGLLPG